MTLAVEFKDRKGHIAHQAFQEWRQEHPNGYYLTFATKKQATLHLAQGCHHPGNVFWTYEETGHSLTKKRKLCSDTEAVLLAAARSDGVEVSRCAHC